MKEKLQIEVICELCLFFATICEPLTFLGYSTNSSSNCRVKETRSFVPPVHTPTATFAMTVFSTSSPYSHPYVMMPIILLPLGKRQHMLLLGTLYANSTLALSLGLTKWVRCQVFKLLIPSYLKNFLSKSKLANMVIESIN